MFFNMLLFCLKGYYETLKEYISRIDKHMNLPSDQLTFTLRKHFKGSSTDTMRRRMKEVFVKNNIDFSPHSRWAVSTNKAQSIDVNIDNIITRGCWKNRENVFKLYDKNTVEFAPDDMVPIVSFKNRLT